MGRALAPLRHEHILLVATGGIVHNLSRLAPGEETPYPDPWAAEFDTWVRDNGEACDGGKVKCSYDHPYNQPVAVNIDANSRFASLLGNIFGYPGLVEWMTGKGLSLAYEGGNNAKYRHGYTGPGGGKFEDHEVKATLLRHQNYDFKSKQQLACNARRSDFPTDCQDGGADPVLPKSLYLTAPPDYWCAELSFPAIDA